MFREGIEVLHVSRKTRPGDSGVQTDATMRPASGDDEATVNNREAGHSGKRMSVTGTRSVCRKSYGSQENMARWHAF